MWRGLYVGEGCVWEVGRGFCVVDVKLCVLWGCV